jgi:hypothetical protein
MKNLNFHTTYYYTFKMQQTFLLTLILGVLGTVLACLEATHSPCSSDTVGNSWCECNDMSDSSYRSCQFSNGTWGYPAPVSPLQSLNCDPGYACMTNYSENKSFVSCIYRNPKESPVRTSEPAKTSHQTSALQRPSPTPESPQDPFQPNAIMPTDTTNTASTQISHIKNTIAAIFLVTIQIL